MAGASKWLEEQGLFTFDSDGLGMVAEYASLKERIPPFLMTQTDVADYTTICAAEFALLPLFGRAGGEFEESRSRLPVHVQSADVRLAIMKTDCGPGLSHANRSSGGIELWDVMLFAGDMAKVVILLDMADGSALAEPDVMTKLVEGLRQTHSESPDGRRVLEAGLLELEATLWSAKLLALGPTGFDPERIRRPDA